MICMPRIREAFGVRRIPALSIRLCTQGEWANLKAVSSYHKAPEYGALQTLREVEDWSDLLARTRP
jgi:hypothetical protein